ncbi:SDR family oxidoreductase [Microlunatus panaciterrae]|uniref:2-deoxy-D-gluconate 3-dehydrogenase n=1 Tax=Microlunatus panaciterrae TaxID=400768 RepID=A0ABS2RJA2_9ACTN|nr:SDR family oxidoreductase [Microlunatus panaciterrae]MBM7799074.1 2-deoxy-D-gluconate 3-dehydrogenase [Microlunatus panaciterrae]
MRTPSGSPFDLSGRTAVVTGASRGIGLSIALGLVDAGADLIGLQRGPLAAHLEERAEWRGVTVRRVPVELADESSVAMAIEEALRPGPVDILVNNAGTQIRHDAEDFPLEDFDRVLAVNTRAVFQLCQGFGRPMLERGWGRIVNVASLLSFQGGIRVPAYAASKGAVTQITKALCNEWAGRGVNVNAVAPGYIDTEMNEALAADPVRREQLTVRIPAGRWGTGDDLAGAVVFLSSEAAAYVNGVVLPVDGGWLAR